MLQEETKRGIVLIDFLNALWLFFLLQVRTTKCQITQLKTQGVIHRKNWPSSVLYFKSPSMCWVPLEMSLSSRRSFGEQTRFLSWRHTFWVLLLQISGFYWLTIPWPFWRFIFRENFSLGKLFACTSRHLPRPSLVRLSGPLLRSQRNDTWKSLGKKTLPHLGRRPSRRIVCIVILIWLVSFLVAGLPPYVFYTYNSVTRQCYADYTPKAFRIVTIVNAISLFFLPLCIITFSYQRISKVVGQRALRLQDQTPNSSLEASLQTIKKNTDAIVVQTRKTKRILKPLVILFAFTMLPYHLFALLLACADMSTLLEDLNETDVIVVITFCVAINSAGDPFVYCIMNNDFRREIKTALSRCFRGRLGTWRRSFRTANFSSLQISKRSAGITNETFVQTHHETHL